MSSARGIAFIVVVCLFISTMVGDLRAIVFAGFCYVGMLLLDISERM